MLCELNFCEYSIFFVGVLDQNFEFLKTNNF